MKNVIAKTLIVSAAALLATGCVSTSTFNDYVAKNDAAVAAAGQSAAAAVARKPAPARQHQRETPRTMAGWR